MKKCFRLIDEDHARVTSYELCDNASKSFYTITCLVNELCCSVKAHCVRIYTPFLSMILRRPTGKSNSKLPQMCRIKDKVSTEGLGNYATHFTSFSIVAE